MPGVGHAAQLPVERVTEIAPGGTVTQRWVPVRRVGLYVPGGLALYPSSVVMNVVPAQVAGVPAIAVTSPPQRDNDGWPDPNVLAACALLGVDEVYAAGGAQGIALLALGAADVDGTVIEPVDVITGPGNVYVTAAKRLLRGTVAIDSEAGPTEIAVLADDSADPVHVAADLISQAEHDPLAASVLITTSVALADAVDALLAQRVSQTKHHDRVRQALSGRQSGTVLVALARRRASRSQTPTPPSTWRSRPGTRQRLPAGSATPGRCSSGRTRRCRWATTAPGRTMCCPPAGPPGSPPGSTRSPSCGRCR